MYSGNAQWPQYFFEAHAACFPFKPLSYASILSLRSLELILCIILGHFLWGIDCWGSHNVHKFNSVMYAYFVNWNSHSPYYWKTFYLEEHPWMMTRILSWQDYPVSTSYSCCMGIGVVTTTFFDLKILITSYQLSGSLFSSCRILQNTIFDKSVQIDFQITQILDSY